MTKRNTKEVRPSPAERSPRTHATSSKPDQNEQNSKLTDGAYFLFDGYPNRPRCNVDPLANFIEQCWTFRIVALVPDRTAQPGQPHRSMFEERPKERATEPSTSAERFRLGALRPVVPIKPPLHLLRHLRRPPVIVRGTVVPKPQLLVLQGFGDEERGDVRGEHLRTMN